MGIIHKLKSSIERLKGLKQGEGLVIVCGMPKSGTTALARLLGASLGVNVSSDPFVLLDERGVVFRDMLFQQHLSLSKLWLENRLEFKGRVIKDPNFPLLLDQLVEFLPKAKYIFLVRDPRYNIRSILSRVELPGDPRGIDLKKKDIGRTWMNLLQGVTPDMPGGNYIERLSWRWVKSAENIHRYRDLGVVVRYEDFNACREEFIYSLCNDIGLNSKVNISNLVNVQFQPKGKASGSIEEFFGSELLAAINNITAPQLSNFHYGKL